MGPDLDEDQEIPLPLELELDDDLDFNNEIAENSTDATDVLERNENSLDMHSAAVNETVLILNDLYEAGQRTFTFAPGQGKN